MNPRIFRADERLNQLNDRDDMWGPLVFLRPAKHRAWSATRALVISGILGGFYGMLGNAVISLLARAGSVGKPSVLLMPVLLTAMYFICGQLSLVAAWNRRARQLSRRLDWSELTGRPVSRSRDDEQAAE
jgi:hypothetical protein